MLNQNAWTTYPRANLAFGQIGPQLSKKVFTAQKPTQIVSATPAKALDLKPKPAPFTKQGSDAYPLKYSVGFQVAEPASFMLPNMRPQANFSIPTGARLNKPVSLLTDLNEDTKDLRGMDLLNAIVKYVMKQDVSTLNAKEFEGVLKACERLGLSADPKQAGLRDEYDNNISVYDQAKLLVWLLATESADPSIKRGQVKLEPGSQIVPFAYLNKVPRWFMRTVTRVANVDRLVDDVNAAEDYNDEEREDLERQGYQLPFAPSAPNLAQGRDGNNSYSVSSFGPEGYVSETLQLIADSANRRSQLNRALVGLDEPKPVSRQPSRAQSRRTSVWEEPPEYQPPPRGLELGDYVYQGDEPEYEEPWEQPLEVEYPEPFVRGLDLGDAPLYRPEEEVNVDLPQRLIPVDPYQPTFLRGIDYGERLQNAPFDASANDPYQKPGRSRRNSVLDAIRQVQEHQLRQSAQLEEKSEEWSRQWAELRQQKQDQLIEAARLEKQRRDAEVLPGVSGPAKREDPFANQLAQIAFVPQDLAKEEVKAPATVSVPSTVIETLNRPQKRQQPRITPLTRAQQESWVKTLQAPREGYTTESWLDDILYTAEGRFRDWILKQREKGVPDAVILDHLRTARQYNPAKNEGQSIKDLTTKSRSKKGSNKRGEGKKRRAKSKKRVKKRV